MPKEIHSSGVLIKALLVLLVIGFDLMLLEHIVKMDAPACVDFKAAGEAGILFDTSRNFQLKGCHRG